MHRYRIYFYADSIHHHCCGQISLLMLTENTDLTMAIHSEFTMNPKCTAESIKEGFSLLTEEERI